MRPQRCLNSTRGAGGRFPSTEVGRQGQPHQGQTPGCGVGWRGWTTTPKPPMSTETKTGEQHPRGSAWMPLLQPSLGLEGPRSPFPLSCPVQGPASPRPPPSPASTRDWRPSVVQNICNELHANTVFCQASQGAHYPTDCTHWGPQTRSALPGRHLLTNSLSSAPA